MFCNKEKQEKHKKIIYTTKNLPSNSKYRIYRKGETMYQGKLVFRGIQVKLIVVVTHSA